MTHRDPLFARRRAARNLENAERLVRFPELNAKLPVQTKALYIVFVHGGQSCCFDAFGDLMDRIESNLPAAAADEGSVRFLRFEHDTYHSVSVNAGRLCKMIRDKLLRRPGGDADAKLILVAHSRGGLVARLASDDLIERGLWQDDRLEVFTFGSPHLGTPFFESEVTWAVNHLTQFSGLVRHGLQRFLKRGLRNGYVAELRCHVRAWSRRGALLGSISGSSVLAYRRLAMNFVLGRAASTRIHGPSILRWPPGIEDVRESSEFIRKLPPVPRCSRFWTFGSSYDVRANRQKLDMFSKHVLLMIQRAFVLASGSRGVRAAARSTERNDLVVSLESATAVGIACRSNENLWHCGYFSAAPGEVLARYLQTQVLACSGEASLQRAQYVDPEFVLRSGPPPIAPRAAPEMTQRSIPPRTHPIDPEFADASPAERIRRRR